MAQEVEYIIERLSKPLADLDITQSGSWAGITEFSDDKQKVCFGEIQVILSEKIRFPVIRSISENTVLVADTRIQREYEFNENKLIKTTFLNENNAWIFGSNGEIKANFSAGDAIENIVITKDFIVVTYFDEAACYGEGLVAFDFEGNKLFGYEETFGKNAVEVFDCYASALVKENQIIFCPYTEFPLVLFDLETKTQEVWETPAAVQGSHAITKLLDKIYFHRKYRLELEDYDFGIYEWQIGSKEVRKIGEYQSHFTRGLPNGRLLAQTNSGYGIISLQ